MLLRTGFAPFVCTAKELSIIGGYPDGSFKPEHDVNSAEAAKIVAGAFGLPVQKSTTGPWYQPHMDALNSLGALPSSTQDPAHLLTRGEMAELIYRIMQPKP